MVAEAATGAPIVDRLDTRRLESRQVRKGFVYGVEVAEIGHCYVAFRTRDRVATTWTDWGDTELRPAESSVGVLRVELVADDVVRVRYAPSGDVGDPDSAMIVGTLPAPSTVAFEEGSDHTRISSPAMHVRVDHKPLTITISTRDGVERCRIGGREKNEWGLWDAYNTGVSRTVDGDRPLATECYALRPGEAVFGCGEQFTRLDKRGQTIDLNMVEATGTTTPRAYKNIPFFWTTHGYGVFWHTSARTTAWVGSRAVADIQVAIEDDHLDQFVFIGSPKQIIDRYTTLTGKAQMPPRWSFGWWQSKISYRSADEVLDVVRSQRAAGLPIDVVHLDTHWFTDDWRNDLSFDPVRFPDPAAFMAELRSMGVHVCVWQLPYIPEGSVLFDELADADAFVRTADGSDIYDVAICYTPGWKGRVGVIDFTNPAAVEVYGRHLRRLHELGVSAIKVDFGEQAPLDGSYYDGTPGHLVHNLYPLLYNKAIAETTHAATGDWIIWARSAWTGSQRYPLHWGGDSSPNWDNLGPQFTGGLSLGCCGFTFWSQDIGGFLRATGGELLIRWLQAGLFCSHTRIHGVGTRELAEHGGEVLRIGREFLELRYRLLPYLLGEAHRSAAAGLPLARALCIEFPDDPSTWPVDDQWLLGEHLLVAPIFDPSGRRRVYLPPGRWADWWTGVVQEGRRWIVVDVPIDRIPLWIRDGGVIALGPPMNHVDEVRTDRVFLRAVAPTALRTDAQGVVDVDGVLAEWRWEHGRLSVDDLPGVDVKIEALQ